jgi:hypothetical protein
MKKIPPWLDFYPAWAALVTGHPSTKYYFYRILFQLMCPHCPATCAGSRAGPPVSECVRAGPPVSECVSPVQRIEYE